MYWGLVIYNLSDFILEGRVMREDRGLVEYDICFINLFEWLANCAYVLDSVLEFDDGLKTRDSSDKAFILITTKDPTSNGWHGGLKESQVAKWG